MVLHCFFTFTDTWSIIIRCLMEISHQNWWLSNCHSLERTRNSHIFDSKSLDWIISMRLVSTGSDSNDLNLLIGAHTTQHGSITWVIRLKQLMYHAIKKLLLINSSGVRRSTTSFHRNSLHLVWVAFHCLIFKNNTENFINATKGSYSIIIASPNEWKYTTMSSELLTVRSKKRLKSPVGMTI